MWLPWGRPKKKIDHVDHREKIRAEELRKEATIGRLSAEQRRQETKALSVKIKNVAEADFTSQLERALLPRRKS